MKFYFSPLTSSLATHIALIECGADYEPHPTLMSKQETRASAYLAVNPAGKVPALVTANGTVITEVAATLYISRDFIPMPASGPKANWRPNPRLSRGCHLPRPPCTGRASRARRASRKRSTSQTPSWGTANGSPTAIRSPTSTSSASIGGSARKSTPHLAHTQPWKPITTACWRARPCRKPSKSRRHTADIAVGCAGS